MSIVCASMHPDRVERMVLYGAMARVRSGPGLPGGRPGRRRRDVRPARQRRVGHGRRDGHLLLQPRRRPCPVIAEVAKFERNACTRQMAQQMIRADIDIDVRALLPAIAAPTLVVHTSDDPLVSPALGRYLADHIPGARFLELPGDYHCSWRLDDTDAVIAPPWPSSPTSSTSPAAPTRPPQRVLASCSSPTSWDPPSTRSRSATPRGATCSNGTTRPPTRGDRAARRPADQDAPATGCWRPSTAHRARSTPTTAIQAATTRSGSRSAPVSTPARSSAAVRTSAASASTSPLGWRASPAPARSSRPAPSAS